MAVAAPVFYNSFKDAMLSASPIDLIGDTIKVALLLNTYTPDIDAHNAFDDVAAHEHAAAGGYNADGETLAGKTATQDDVNDRGLFDADDVTWAASTITARYALIYKRDGADADSPLIAYIDFGEDKATSAEHFTLDWNNSGIFALN